jgi:hypothetical protein
MFIGEHDESWNYKQPTPGEFVTISCVLHPVLLCWVDEVTLVSISRGDYDESWNYKQPTPGDLMTML